MEILTLAREKLAEVTPLSRDCGALCEAACCSPDEDGLGGMLLYPMEEAFYRDLPEGFVIADDRALHGSRLLTCEGFCERGDRPLACRIFPLMFVEKNGQLDVSLDPRAWPVCPLMPSGMEGLKPAFVNAAREAAALLGQDEALRAWVVHQADWVKQLTRPLWD